MGEMNNISVSPYALAAVALWVLLYTVCVLRAQKNGLKEASVCRFALLSGLLSLLLGRLVYCLVKADSLFVNEMGESLGLLPFLDLSKGGISLIGVLMGLTGSALICKLWGDRPSRLLDYAVCPALLIYIVLRLLEPTINEGRGSILESTLFAFKPIAQYNEMLEEWVLSVYMVEAILALFILIVLFLLRHSFKKDGTLALLAALLFSVTQILPEQFRQGDVLKIFVFARVTHIGLAVLLLCSLLLPLLRGKRRGLKTAVIIRELLLMLLGIALCIGAIFALDKTNLPKLVVYGALVVSLLGMFVLTFRRIIAEDKRH